MNRYFVFLVPLLASLACTTSSMVITVTPDPAPSKSAVLASRFSTPTISPLPLAAATVDSDGAGQPQQMTVCTDALNVRSGPSLESAAVAWLRDGDIVYVLESRDGWARVAGGWVKGVYLC